MRNKILAAMFLIALLAVITNVYAQASIVRIEKSLTANRLSGVVLNQLDSRMQGVKVSIVTRGWGNEIKSTKTDVKGGFSFRKLPPKLYYLRFTALAFNPLEVKVRIRKNSKAKLKFIMEIGT